MKPIDTMETWRPFTITLTDDCDDKMFIQETQPVGKQQLLIYNSGGSVLSDKEQIRDLAYRLLHWCNTGSLKLPTDKEI